MLCTACGANMEDNVKICPNCGHAVKQDWKQGLYTTKIDYDIQKISSRREKRKPEVETVSDSEKEPEKPISEPSAESVETGTLDAKDITDTTDTADVIYSTHINDTTDAIDSTDITDTTEIVDIATADDNVDTSLEQLKQTEIEITTENTDKKRKLSGFKKGLLITLASILILAALTAFGYFSNKLVLSNYKSWDEMINIFLGLK